MSFLSVFLSRFPNPNLVFSPSIQLFFFFYNFTLDGLSNPDASQEFAKKLLNVRYYFVADRWAGDVVLDEFADTGSGIPSAHTQGTHTGEEVTVGAKRWASVDAHLVRIHLLYNNLYYVY
jgi:hypothetical protein